MPCNSTSVCLPVPYQLTMSPPVLSASCCLVLVLFTCIS